MECNNKALYLYYNRMENKDSLPHHVICQMCSQPFSDPRMLPCLHSFCCQCLHNKMQKCGPQQNIQCPTCLRSIAIPAGGASILPKNIRLGYETEVAEYVAKFVSSGGVSCTFCINGCTDPAVSFCCSCTKFQGGQDSHSRAPQLSHHSVMRLDEESAKLLPTVMKPANQHCYQPKHTNEKMTFYCKTCSCLICRDCTVVLHKDHNITELWIVAEDLRDEMRGTLQCAQEVVSTLAGAINANIKMAKQVENSKQEAELSIEHTFTQLIETLEERKKALLSELETISLSKVTSLNLQKEQLEKIQQDIGHYTEMTSHILQTHTDHEVVALGGLVPTELKATLKNVENMSLVPNEQSYVTFSVLADPLVKEMAKLGNIMTPYPAPQVTKCTFAPAAKANAKYYARVETMTSEGGRYQCGGLQVKAELRPKSHDGPVVSGEVEDHGDGTYAITITPIHSGPHQLHVTMDGQHVHNSPYDLRVMCDYTVISNPQREITVGGNPYCVAIHDNGDIYVSSSDGSIYVFDQQGQSKGTIAINDSGNGQFNGPGISIKGDVMYVVDYCNHHIRRLATEGKCLQEFAEKGPDQGQFNGPWDIVVDSKTE